MHSILRNHPLVLNVSRTRKIVDRQEPPAKMSKLAIAAESEDDHYDIHTYIKCLECGLSSKDSDVLKASSSSKLDRVVSGIMTATTYSRKEEVKAWEQELTPCEHTLLLQQHRSRKIDPQNLANCSNCGLKENLWLCLECGNLGCGRAQFGGMGGNSHGLAHYNECQHPVAVKLGSITPEGTADVYCYKCDDEKVDENLGEHLAHWGIILAERQKTEKSLTEMQIEQNLRWEFTMVTEDGKQLEPRFGPGLTGLKNLGNSCYLASVLQCLFDLPSFRQRYSTISEPLTVVDPAEDLETQLQKIGHGLLSGEYSKPDPDVVLSPGEVGHQKGIAPAMLKALIGRGHPEFSTMRQQDSFEIMQHLFKLVTRSPHPGHFKDPTVSFKFIMEQRLQCMGCKKVRYTSTEQDSIMVDVPLEQVPTLESEPPLYKPVTMKKCLDILTAEEMVELTCSGCGRKDGYKKRTLFKTFPDVLTINARKMAIVNWVPIKVDVPILVDESPLDLSSYLSLGKQNSETLLPEETVSKPSFTPNTDAMGILEAMGFPKNRCERALHATGNSDANSAMEWLLAHLDDPSIDDRLDLGEASGPGVGPDPEKMEMLKAMGISGGKASRALRETGGDLERAVDWVFSHPEVGDEDGDEVANGPEEATEAGSNSLPARFQLQSIVCHKGTSIHTGLVLI